MLEIGGGLGVLREHLAARAAHVHVVELDRGSSRRCATRSTPFPNTTLHFADAMELDLAALDPAPTKVVANLPYGIAAGAILRTIEELPAVTRWVAMVQKEVGERLAAAPGTPAYGLPSVLAQLAPTCASSRASRARSSTRCRTSTACSCPRAHRPRRPPALRRWRPTPSRTGARRWRGRSRWPGGARGARPRSRGAPRPGAPGGRSRRAPRARGLPPLHEELAR